MTPQPTDTRLVCERCPWRGTLEEAERAHAGVARCPRCNCFDMRLAPALTRDEHATAAFSALEAAHTALDVEATRLAESEPERSRALRECNTDLFAAAIALRRLTRTSP